MADRDALVVPVTTDWDLTIAGIQRDRAGDIHADVILSNGVPAHAERIALTTPAARMSFATSATGDGRPDAAAIVAALLAVLPETLGSLQVSDAPRRSQADELVTLALASKPFLFHTPDGDAYASIDAGSHRETWPLRAKGFRRWLARRFYEEHDKAPGSQAVQDALGVLEGKALYDGSAEAVHVRVAGVDSTIYLDLGDDNWRAVEVTANGWRVIDNPPVRFRRAKGMLALPVPEPGGTLAALQPFLNVTDEDMPLVRAWLIQALRDRGPYPAMIFTGEQGSAKSTSARACRALVDPSSAPLRRPPRDERDLMIAATNSWTIVLDNVSGITPWLSDALCTLATGGGYATRELYADADETLFNVQRPTILTSIEDVVTRGDMIDRSLLVTLPAIADTRRRPEAGFWREFERQRPAILGALLGHVAQALATIDTVKQDRLPRMADFALWASAAESTKGRNAFTAAYTSNRASAHDIALEGSQLAASLFKHMNGRERWEGTAAELLLELAVHVSDKTREAKAWPKTPRGLGGQLRRLAPHLRAKELHISFERRGHANDRIMVLEWVRQQSSASSASSADSQVPYSDAETPRPGADGMRTVADGWVSDTDRDRPHLAMPYFRSTSQNEQRADDADDADGRMQTDSNGACFVCGTALYESRIDGLCRTCRTLAECGDEA